MGQQFVGLAAHPGLIPHDLSSPKHRAERLVGPTHVDRAVLAQEEGEDLFGVLARDRGARPRPDIREMPERNLEGEGDPIEAIDRDRFLTALNLTDELATECRALAGACQQE